ncbi:TIGR02677 family protein [Raineyella antarctica]|uniref:TIGR02677 family protein n=1 Tax=Raineyella antarctica TaxID=1577474 RepID=A0A1G6HHN2_9ACTN|nr:TIGR02677 family protein [Raineyella antarctica]SDB93653.1 TIGR02677 family protein [Raineyella antarctica]
MTDTAMPASSREPEPLESWSLLGLPGTLSAASFLTSTRAHQYRLIVDILAERQTQSLTGVGHDELTVLLRERLPLESSDELLTTLNVDERLAQLVQWGTCEAWQETASTEADFLRNRFRYQLTEAGAELHRTALRIEIEAGAGSTAALMAPASLAERLEATISALRSGDLGAASSSYAQVQTTLENMASSASTWQSKLAAALGGAPEEAKVTRLLETILAYVEAWGSGIDAYTARIADALPTLRAMDDDIWRGLALVRVQTGAPEHTLAGTIDELRGIISTLELWFSGPSPQAQRLRRQMRDAVAPVLRSHRTLLAVGGTVSRRVELLRLARALEAAPDADVAWELWVSATGLFSARHLRLEAPAIDNAQHTSTWDAPPAPVSRRLRTQGHRSVAGRTARIPDMAGARAEARSRAARDRADLALAEAALAARSGTRLADWDPLDAAQTDLFLRLVSDARDNRTPDGTQTGLSADGRWRLVLHPVEPAAYAVLHTPDGRLLLPDAYVEISP